MRGRRWVQLARLGVASAVLMLTLTACSTTQVEADLRFGWPTGVTKQAEKMRVLWTWSSVSSPSSSASSPGA